MSTQKKYQKIGLLGGSFNPAHAGHVHISQHAIDFLGLDEIWWLVSLQNPQKLAHELAPLEQRIDLCNVITKDIHKISIKSPESDNRTQFTCDIIPIIQELNSDATFVWLMGADNLVSFHTWRNWKSLMSTVAIAILDREPYSYRALASTAAISYAANRQLSPTDLTTSPLPAWSYVRIPTINLSSTELRKQSA